MFSLVAVLFNSVGPAFAGFVEPQGLDPRVVELLKDRPCGAGQKTEPALDVRAAAARLVAFEPVRESSADSAEFVALDSDPDPIPTASPATAAPKSARGQIAFDVAAIQSSPAPASPASSAPESTASPTPDASSSAAPDANSSPATQTASPSPGPSGTFIPIPGIPNVGSQKLVAPTARPVNPTASPYPLPSVSPTLDPNAPVFLVRPSGTPSPIALKGASPAPNGSPTPVPYASPVATLGPYQIVTIADRLEGSSDRTKPSDLYGNVHVFYSEGQIVGDRAHYDGDHTIVVRGHTYLVNRSQDSILYADEISFDMTTRQAKLLNGSGESIEGVAQGKLHYNATQLTALSNGTSHGDRASFSTCENPHAGYHVEARTIDVIPGNKIIARKAVLFLGPTAILYLPLLIIPLIESVDSRRRASFIPVLGYDDIEGFYIKAQIGFGTTETYYGYYRVDYFTKRGLGLGYVAYIGAKDAHRYTTIDSYTISDRVENARETNINVQDTENFSKNLRAQLGATYQGDFGPGLNLPASLSLTGSIIHQAGISTENLTFSRFLQGSLSDNLNLGFLDTINLSQALQEQVNLTYSKFNSPTASNDTFQIDSNTHWFTKFADYNLEYDKTNYSADDFGYDKIPELQIIPHFDTGGNHFLPQIQFALGDYSERQNNFNTTRAQAQIDEAIYLKVFGNSDFSANYNLTQDYYGTGDEKAFDQQNASLSTPIGSHIVNSLTYNEDHPIGPIDVPFQLFDRLTPAAHSAQDIIRFYNKDIYSFSLGAGTNFDRMAQAVTYQLNVRPSPRSYLVFGGFFQPGGGAGFTTTNVQAITPFGKDTTLEFSTNVDWKNHNRLENKNVYLTKTVDACYNLQLAYNQDLKSFTFNVVILAFPGQTNGFGFTGGQGSPIVPGALGF